MQGKTKFQLVGRYSRSEDAALDELMQISQQHTAAISIANRNDYLNKS